MGARSLLLLLRYHRSVRSVWVDAYSEKCLCFSFAIDVLGVSSYKEEGNDEGFWNYKSKGNILDKFILDNLLAA